MAATGAQQPGESEEKVQALGILYRYHTTLYTRCTAALAAAEEERVAASPAAAAAQYCVRGGHHHRLVSYHATTALPLPPKRQAAVLCVSSRVVPCIKLLPFLTGPNIMGDEGGH